jgi:hypothetical protein
VSTAILYFDFIVIKHHLEYLNFSITFSLGKHFWEAKGMGWMGKKSVHYYISSILMNKKHASFEDAKEVGIAMVQDSAVFEYLQLDHLTKSYIKTKLAKP